MEDMMKKLPARPNLEHLRSQAKTLLSELKAGKREAAAAFTEYLPAARKLKPEEMRTTFRLSDAQSVVARKSGFSSWPLLVRHVEELRALEGTWEFVDLEVDGSRMPVAAFGNSRMLIDGDRFRMESPDANYEGIFTINIEETPHLIDIEFVEGPEAGNWSYGIFEVNGDHFKICLGLTGRHRPSDFKTSPGSGHALENLRRVLRQRPENVKGGVPQARRAAAPATKVDKATFNIPMTPLLSRLEGTWIPTQLVQDGQALAEPMLAFGARSVTGNEVKVIFGGQTMVHVKMRADESQSPIAVDYLHVGTSLSGQVSFGIMEWRGEEVRFCMAAPGHPRPTEFSCEPGSGRTLSQWRRK
jgi:uncharacterized protein (TIGR03067 family)